MQDPNTHVCLSVGDVRLEGRWAGPRQGRDPVLVFLHDGLGCIATWRGSPDRISERTGLPAFMFSRAGYGGSDPITLPRPLDYETREAANVLPQVLDAAGISRAILVGHSDGATMALIYAARARPMLAEALVAMAPHVFNEAVSVAGIRRTVKEYEKGDLRPRLARLHGANVDCAFRGWSDAWLDPAFRQWSIARVLPSVRIPVLVIQGDADEYGSMNQVGAIVEGVSGPVRSQVLPGCGHTPHCEQPQVTEDAIVQFVRSVIVGSASSAAD